MPSGEVITRLPLPLLLTAASSPNSFAQANPNQLLSAGVVRVVQGCLAQ
jgi:hypothetical protein